MLLERLGCWIEKAKNDQAVMKQGSILKCEEEIANTTSLLTDWKVVINKPAPLSNEDWETLAKLPDAASIVQGVKALNVHIKEWDAFVTAFKTSNIPVDIEETLLKKARETRDAGRLQESVRQGAEIIFDNTPEKIEQYMEGCKQAKTKACLPAQMVKKLTAMKSAAS